MSHPPNEPDSTRTVTGSPFDGFGTVARSIGQFVAPATLLVAVLFYFGWAHVYWFFHYFGVDSTTLDPSMREYLMRTVDALFVPLTVVAVIGMTLQWGYLALPDSVRRREPGRWVKATVVLVAAAALVNGLSRIYVITPFNRGLCVAPISIIAGTLLLWLMVVRRRARRPRPLPDDAATQSQAFAAAAAEWSVLFVIIGLSLFWIATDYSVAVGQTRARQWAAQLADQPGVVIYSEKDLHLSRTEVRTVDCHPDPAIPAAYRFRYDGLVPLTRIGDHYVLVPRSWTPDRGAAIALPSSPPGAIRFEFRGANESAPPNC
ncbi:hypothetical protein [Nocardia sp. NPDC058705]|uniref:hypothetical protein n=1 Tax=Nocardia sp. NPDC058705 TaxID=3346609 RepID=UPI00369C1A7C